MVYWNNKGVRSSPKLDRLYNLKRLADCRRIVNEVRRGCTHTLDRRSGIRILRTKVSWSIPIDAAIYRLIAHLKCSPFRRKILVKNLQNLVKKSGRRNLSG